MKREEVTELFPGATDEQVDAILNKFAGELNPLKRSLKDATSKLDEANASLEATKASEAGLKSQLEDATAKIQAGMTAEELLAQREKEAEAREREFLLKSNGLDAKALFVEAGVFDEEDIGALVAQVVSDDAEQTTERAKRIVETVLRQRKAVEEATREELMRANPKPKGASGVDTPMKRADFLSLPYTEQLAMKEANPDILSQLV